jgi:hypothetical protein
VGTIRIASMAFVVAVLAARTAFTDPWFVETFDSYHNGPLRKQGDWVGFTDQINVVSSNSLAGKAAWLDADGPQMPPAVQSVERLLDVPRMGRQLLSFVVKIDTTTPYGDRQGALEILTDYMMTLSFTVESSSVIMTAQHPLLDIPPSTAIWDLGTSPGGRPDFSTGVYHLVEWEIGFDVATSPPAARLLDARVDGLTYASLFTRPLPAVLWIAGADVRVSLVNGSTLDGATPDNVFFDQMIGQSLAARARRWTLY